MASKILSILNLDKNVKLNKVNSDFFKQEYFAPRPASERLVNKKLQLRNLDIMRDWETCLEEYLNKSFKNFL